VKFPEEEVYVEEDTQDLVHVPDRAVDNILTIAEKRLENIKRVKEMALSLTNMEDWKDLGGKPYLQASGCEKVARPFGVKIKLKNPAFQKISSSDERGAFYIYLFFGTASLGNGLDSIDVIGKCSSRDKFFGTVEGELRPVAEVPEENIMMKAYNNLLMNGISRVLGLRNMTWEEVRAGIGKRENIKKAAYHSRKADIEQDVNDRKNATVAEIHRLLQEAFENDEQAKREMLYKVTEAGNQPRAKTVDELKKFTHARVVITMGKLKKELGQEIIETGDQEKDKHPAKEEKGKTSTLDL